MHKWAAVIKAWADGSPIQLRESNIMNEWGPWRPLKDGHAPIRTDMYVEYRVQPENPPHKWQQEKEAYLDGKRVEFRNKGIYDWYLVDSWLEAYCRRQGLPLWDRPHLEFRIVPD